ncbi:MAG: O-methyltransferase [Promethearchaeota archaeon]
MSTNEAEMVLQQIEASQNHNIIGRQRGQILVRLAREFHPRRILEVGTNVGYSAILMGKELPSRTSITTIEINPKYAKEAKENIRRAAIEPTVEVLIGDALEILPTLNGEFDLVFLDAIKTQYLSYLKASEPHLFRGSMVIADNIVRRSDEVQDYLEYVRESGEYTSRIIIVGNDGVELSIKR